MNDDFLTVRKGDPITAEIWNRMQRAGDRSSVLLGGENTRISRMPHGTLINAKHVGVFVHPFRVTVSGLSAIVLPGLVNGEVPTMRLATGSSGVNVPLDNRPPPVMKLSRALFDQIGQGWIALELKVEEKFFKIEKAEVIQCANITQANNNVINNPFFYFGLPGLPGGRVRYPIARLFLRGGGIECFQVAMFNMNHKTKPPAPAGTGNTMLPRHFFWPA